MAETIYITYGHPDFCAASYASMRGRLTSLKLAANPKREVEHLDKWINLQTNIR
jgi:hypothetical protein